MDLREKEIRFYEIGKKMEKIVNEMQLAFSAFKRDLLTAGEYVDLKKTLLDEFRQVEEEFEELLSQSGA